ncbi:hypothetical protein [Arthrobacter sp. MMS24-S77]
MKPGNAVLTAANLVAGYGDHPVCGPLDVELFSAPELLVTPAVVLNAVLLVIGVTTADRP